MSNGREQRTRSQALPSGTHWQEKRQWAQTEIHEQQTSRRRKRRWGDGWSRTKFVLWTQLSTSRPKELERPILSCWATTPPSSSPSSFASALAAAMLQLPVRTLKPIFLSNPCLYRHRNTQNIRNEYAGVSLPHSLWILTFRFLIQTLILF